MGLTQSQPTQIQQQPTQQQYVSKTQTQQQYASKTQNQSQYCPRCYTLGNDNKCHGLTCPEGYSLDENCRCSKQEICPQGYQLPPVDNNCYKPVSCLDENPNPPAPL